MLRMLPCRIKYLLSQRNLALLFFSSFCLSSFLRATDSRGEYNPSQANPGVYSNLRA